MTATLTLALSKGRIFDETLPLLRAAGIEVLEDPETSRKLILPTNQALLRVVLVRASDVPTYVQYGGADLGVTGLDTLIEHGGDWAGSGTGLYQPLDLKIAKCRMSVAVRADFDYVGKVKQGARLKVATKYTECARLLRQQRRACGHGEVVRLNGISAFDRFGRCHRRLGLDGQYAQSQPLGGSGAHHGYQLAFGGESSLAQNEASADPPHH